MDERSIFPEVIKTLIAVIEEKDVFIRGHSLRVAQGCVRMAKRLGFTKPDQDRLFLAGLLHDIGMVYVPQELVAKTDRLSEEEMEVVKKHPLVAEKILAHLRLLQPVVPMIRHHHEWYDGSGYPDGLRGNDIPQGARILAIVDCYDALVSARPHRPAKTAVEAIAEMQTLSGTQFDTELFTIFADLVVSETATVAPAGTEIADTKATDFFAALVDKVRSGKIELPVLPEVVMDIQRVIKSPIATTQEVAAAIEKDAVISLRLIATANSPLYRGAKKVLTVREAVPRLGIKQTQSIVNAIANRGLYETTNEEFTALMQRLWLHALASAYTARAIAKLTKRDDYEIYFTYGLVHDIGKVLLVRAALEKMQRGVADMTTDTILPLIQNAHTEIGALLLERWGFPEQFKNAALLHENDSYSEATPHEVLVVNLANLLTRSFGCSLFSSDENTSAAYPAAQLLKIEMAALQSIAAEVKSIMHDSPTLF